MLHTRLQSPLRYPCIDCGVIRRRRCRRRADYRFLEEALVTNESSKRIKPNEEVGSVAASKTNWEVVRSLFTALFLREWLGIGRFLHHVPRLGTLLPAIPAKHDKREGKHNDQADGDHAIQ
jgi:hypothetical protein